MSLTRKTVMDTVQIDRHGNISVRLGLLILDGESEADCKWHRVAASAGEDLGELIDHAEEDLLSQGLAALSASSKEALRLAIQFRADIQALNIQTEG